MALTEPRYVFLCHLNGIFCFKIPDDPKQLESVEVELAWKETKSINTMMHSMGMFAVGRYIYLVGGRYFSLPIRFDKHKLHVFCPSADQSRTMHPLKIAKYKPIVEPTVFHVKGQTYLLSLFERKQQKPLFTFQAFCPRPTVTYLLSHPPFPFPFPFPFFRCLDSPDLSFDNFKSTFTVGHFIVLDYIYLFIKEIKYGSRTSRTPTHSAFAFDTRSEKWEKLDSLCSTFVDKKIPFPYGHNGDTGISVAFSGNNRILVALTSGKPTAYRVSVDEAGGSLQLESHRLLVDHYSTLHGIGGRYSEDTMSHLFGLGDEKFCVVYSNRDTPLLVYIFKMDFRLEYFENNSGTAKKSVVILSSKKFKQNITVFMDVRPSSACLGFGFAPTSSHENVEVDHSKQHDEPAKIEEDHEVAYVEDFTEMDLVERRKDDLF